MRRRPRARQGRSTTSCSSGCGSEATGGPLPRRRRSGAVWPLRYSSNSASRSLRLSSAPYSSKPRPIRVGVPGDRMKVYLLQPYWRTWPRPPGIGLTRPRSKGSKSLGVASQTYLFRPGWVRASNCTVKSPYRLPTRSDAMIDAAHRKVANFERGDLVLADSSLAEGRRPLTQDVEQRRRKMPNPPPSRSPAGLSHWNSSCRSRGVSRSRTSQAGHCGTLAAGRQRDRLSVNDRINPTMGSTPTGSPVEDVPRCPGRPGQYGEVRPDAPPSDMEPHGEGASSTTPCGAPPPDAESKLDALATQSARDEAAPSCNRAKPRLRRRRPLTRQRTWVIAARCRAWTGRSTSSGCSRSSSGSRWDG